jgi:CRP/FNR family transcriptional regulator, cyclic AMP receptor protein
MPQARVSPADLLSFLKQVPLLAELDDATLTELAHVCRVERVAKDAVIFSRGDPTEAVYIIRSGTVAEYAGGPNELEIVIKERREGDFFGEMGILLGEPYLVTTVTMRASELVVIPRDEFMRLIRSQPSITQYLLGIFARRLKISGEQLTAYAFLDAPARLAYMLLRLESDEGGSGSITVSQEDLAQRCGLARQTVARILGEWRQADWIMTRRGSIRIVDRTSLTAVMSESRSTHF